MRKSITQLKGLSATIVIPCFNEGERLKPFLMQLCRVTRSFPGIHILVVDDGSKKHHVELEKSCIEDSKALNKNVLFMPLPHNQGKGGALEAGFNAATTPIVGFADADGSTGAEECLNLITQLSKAQEEPGTDGIVGVLGSRIKLLGKTVDRIHSRHLMGRIFATLVCKLFGIPVYDSQCGCKFFLRREVVPLLPLIQSRGWLWDTQLILLLYLAGKSLIEIPVSWTEVAGTKISFIRDPIRMFVELFRFRRYIRDIDYPPALPTSINAAVVRPESKKAARK